MHKRILVIEPSHTIRVLLASILGNAGHQVATFADATTAFAFLSPGPFHKESPHIAFVAFPSSAEESTKESYTAIATLMKQYPHLLVIAFLPLNADQKELQRLEASGAMYLIRPFTVQDILVCTAFAYRQAQKGNVTL